MAQTTAKEQETPRRKTHGTGQASTVLGNTDTLGYHKSWVLRALRSPFILTLSELEGKRKDHPLCCIDTIVLAN